MKKLIGIANIVKDIRKNNIVLKCSWWIKKNFQQVKIINV